MLVPTVAQASFRPLSTSPTTAIHDSLPLDPLPSASSSSSPANVVLSASSSEASSSDWQASTSLGFGLSLSSAFPSSSPAPYLSTSPTPFPTADTLLSTPTIAVDVLNSQPQKYIVASLYSRRYLLHPKDILTVPQIKPFLPLGTKITLTRIGEVGTHAYQLCAEKGHRLTGVSCEATVLEHTTSPMEVKHLKKRRKGYKKEIRSKHRFTRLRISDIVVRSTEQAVDLEAKERTLDRPVSKPYDQYRVSDTSIRGKLATRFGIVDYGLHRDGAGQGPDKA